jgi:molybdate transport system ATP-binding protein
MPDTSPASGLSVEVRQESPIPLDVSFTCGPEDVLAIYGPSGSGKTTLLRCIAGLHTPMHARIVCNGETWTDTGSVRDGSGAVGDGGSGSDGDDGSSDNGGVGHVNVPTYRRRVGLVFQDYALFPHLTARGNVMAALGDRPAAERKYQADRWLSLVHLQGLESRKPAALSGGQRQRVALARALARDPHVVLLDEPFAAVDRTVRQQLHDELDELRRRVRVPVVLVTHDFHDVVRLATHLLLLDRGRVLASGPIEDLTSRTDLPWTLAASPNAHALDTGSIFEAHVDSIDNDRRLATLGFADGTLLVPRGTLQAGTPVRVRIPARDVILATQRPEGLSLHNVLEGRVTAIDVPANGRENDRDRDHALVQVTLGRPDSDTDAVRLLAGVTRDAVARLHLAPGSPVFALIKSVSIETYESRARASLTPNPSP